MPNWCMNTLSIKSKSPEVLEAIKEFVKSETSCFSFQKIRPMPEILHHTEHPDKGFWIEHPDLPFVVDAANPKDSHEAWQIARGRRPMTPEELLSLQEAGGGVINWYDWKCAYWGTKWDAYSAEIYDQEEGRICYQFNTAWSPPEPVIKALFDHFPAAKYKLYYEESGMGFKGSLNVRPKGKSGAGLITESTTFVRMSK